MAKDRKEIGNRYIREAVNLTAILTPVTLTPAESSTSTHHRFCSRAVAVATRLATKDLILSLILCPPLRQVLVSSDKLPRRSHWCASQARPKQSFVIPSSCCLPALEASEILWPRRVRILALLVARHHAVHTVHVLHHPHTGVHVTSHRIQPFVRFIQGGMHF